MAQDIIVVVIVFVAILYTSRRVYRIFSNKKVNCGCIAAEDCSACSSDRGWGGKEERRVLGCGLEKRPPVP